MAENQADLPKAADSAKTGFDKVLALITEKIEDVATLDVVTLTGTLDLKVLTENRKKAAADEADAGKKEAAEKTAAGMAALDPTALFDSLVAEVDTGQLQLVALTRKSLDMDALVIVRSGLDDDGKKLVEAHHQMFAAAEAARLEFLKFLGSVARSFIPLPGR